MLAVDFASRRNTCRNADGNIMTQSFLIYNQAWPKAFIEIAVLHMQNLSSYRFKLASNLSITSNLQSKFKLKLEKVLPTQRRLEKMPTSFT